MGAMLPGRPEDPGGELCRSLVIDRSGNEGYTFRSNLPNLGWALFSQPLLAACLLLAFTTRSRGCIVKQPASSRIARYWPFLLLTLIVACGKDSVTPPAGEGSLYVQVLTPQGAPVVGATVLTDPVTTRLPTDALGAAMLTHVAPGTYRVTATRSGIGSGSAAATVTAGNVTNLTITVLLGVYLEPTVTILSPPRNSSYSYVDSLVAFGRVTDGEDAASALQIRWESSRDGDLGGGPPSSTGNVALRHAPLSRGNHILRLIATDSDGFVGRDSIAVSVSAFAPVVTFTSPAPPNNRFAPGELVRLRGQISDRESPATQISVRWLSDLDGEIGSGHPDQAGAVVLETATLSRGLHTIRLVATDSDGQSAEASLPVATTAPPAITLTPPLLASARVTLSWSLPTTEGIDRLEIYRSTSPGRGLLGNWLATIRDTRASSFTDSLPPFAGSLYYQVYVFNAEGDSRGSEERAVQNAAGPVIGFVPSDALIHPTEPWLYLIREGSVIEVYNYETRERLLTKQLGGASGYMDLRENGFGAELYAVSHDGWINVYDASTLAQSSTINTGLSGCSVVADGSGHVMASLVPSPWWDDPLRSYSRANGGQIDGDGDFDCCRLRVDPGRSRLIEISTSISPTDLDYYEFDAAGNITFHADDRYHGDHPLDPRRFRLSPDGQYFITSSSGAIYTAGRDLTYLGQLPRGSLQFSDFAFDDDGGRIYCGTDNDAGVRVYSYPDLAFVRSLRARGFPEFLFHKGDRLISISRIGAGASSVGIEVIPLN